MSEKNETITRSKTKNLSSEEKEKLVIPGLEGTERKASPTSSVKSGKNSSVAELDTENKQDNRQTEDKRDDKDELNELLDEISHRVSNTDTLDDVSDIPNSKRSSELIDAIEQFGILNTLRTGVNPFPLFYFPDPTETTMEENNRNYNIRLGDAIVMVPTFSGTDDDKTTFDDFIAGCNDAKNMLPEQAEAPLVQLIKTKLRGAALERVREKEAEINTIESLIKVLKEICLPKKSTMELCGDLAQTAQLPTENVAIYYNRIRKLFNNLINAYKSENNNNIDNDRKAEWEIACTKQFIKGLQEDIYQSIKERNSLDKAYSEAIELEAIVNTRRKLISNVLPNSCALCKQPGHLVDNCPKIVNVKQVNNNCCQLCKQLGHNAKECKELYLCQICDQPGHTAVNCNSQKLTPPIHCQLCKRTGHSALTCHFAKVNVVTPTTSSITCNICHKQGHAANRCLANVKCHACNKMGHYARFCRNNNRKFCQNCKMNNHNTDECTINKRNIQRPAQTQNQQRICNYCNKTGHLIQNCFVKQTVEMIKNIQGNLPSLPVREADQMKTNENQTNQQQ